jgi:hypothetical protein
MSMTLGDWLVVAHVVGAATGVGAATASDSVFLRSIRHRRVSSEQFVLIRSTSDVVLVGMTLVALTGVGLLLLSPELIQEPKFQAKMLVVVALLANGLLFHLRILPYLKARRDRWLGDESLTAGRRLLFAGAGAVSAVSWYSALILGAMAPVDIGLPLMAGVYLAVVVAGAVAAYLLLSHLIFAPAPPPEVEAEESTLGEGPAGVDREALVIGGLLVVLVGTLLAVAAGLIG